MAAVITAVVGATITTDRVDSVGRLIASIVDGDDDGTQIPMAVRVTNQLFEETRKAQIWDGTPTIFPESRKFVIDHFREFDPRRPHRFLLPHLPVLSAQTLVADIPLFAGQRVTLVGTVHAVNVGTFSPSISRLRIPGRRKRLAVGNLTYIAQIGPPGENGPLVYCLFTEAAIRRLQPDRWVAAIGVPIAAGTVQLVNGGITPGAYMVAGSVQPVIGPEPVLRVARLIARDEQRRQERSEIP